MREDKMLEDEIPVILSPDELPSDNLLAEYIEMAMTNAVFKELCDGTHFAEIPGFEGAWANADTLEDCRREMKEVLEDWILLGIKLGHPIPVVGSINLKAREKTT